MIELPLAELLLENGEASGGVLAVYRRAIIAFLHNDAEQLQIVADEIESTDKKLDNSELRLAVQLRLGVRKKSLNTENLQTAIEFVLTQPMQSPWRGEFFFIIARAYEGLGIFAAAQANYDNAANELKLAGAQRKALKAQFNALTCATCKTDNGEIVHNPHHYIAKYQEVLRQAEELPDPVVAGLALFNISREYQLAGSIELSLAEANRALQFLQSDYGTLHYQSTLAHRCLLLAEMGRLREAEVDDGELALSNFKEIQAARKVIHARIGLTHKHEVDVAHLRAAWRERWLEVGHSPTETLSALEGKFLHLLGSGPRERKYILRELYSIDMPYEARGNRFNAMLKRLQEKKPGLVVRVGKKFTLAAEIHPHKVGS